MKHTFKYIMSIVVLIMTISSCKKNDTGGDAMVHASVGHHTKPIEGAILYVKFDSREMPSDPTTNYDLKITGESGDHHIVVDGLRAGNYYFYAVGYDSTINSPVTGGIPVEIAWKERKEMFEVEVPVTE